jgi:APA family basic amino acid/polyamine antiporter
MPYETLADGSRDAPIIAVAAAKASLGVQGERIVLAMVMISVFGALNQNILTGPRIIFAAARDHEKLKLIRRVDPRTQTPAIAIAALSLWSIVLLLGASFVASESGTLIETLNSLTGFVIFGGSIFYLLAVVAVFVLRRSMSDAKRPYRTWGYPFTPLVFIAFYVFLLTSVFVGEQKESLAGLALIAAGGLAYFVVRSPQNSQRGSMG